MGNTYIKACGLSAYIFRNISLCYLKFLKDFYQLSFSKGKCVMCINQYYIKEPWQIIGK